MITIKCMPTMQRVEHIGDMFKESDIHFFCEDLGSTLAETFAWPKSAANFLNKLDKTVNVKRAEFKFILVGKKKLP